METSLPHDGMWRTEIEESSDLRDGCWLYTKNKHTGETVAFHMSRMLFYFLDSNPYIVFDRNGIEIPRNEDLVNNKTSRNESKTKEAKTKETVKKNMLRKFPSEYGSSVSVLSNEDIKTMWEAEKGPRGALMKHSKLSLEQKQKYLKDLVKNSRKGVLYGSVGDLRLKTYNGQIYYDKVMVIPCLISRNQENQYSYTIFQYSTRMNS